MGEFEQLLLPKFNSEVEARFRRDYGLFVQRIARFAIPLGAIEYLLFFVWDFAQPGMPLGVTFTIRFSFLALTLFFLAISFTSVFADFSQQIMFSLVTVAMIGVTYILTLTDTGFVNGIAGIGAVVMFGCTLACLRFWWSVALTICTFAVCNLLISLSESAYPSSYVFLNSNIFLAPYCSFGILFSYIIEHGHRSRFRDTGVLVDWIHPKDEPSSADGKKEGAPRIFLCYRRNTTIDITGRIQDRLALLLPDIELVKDLDIVPFGADYRPFLGRVIKTCDLVMLVIGEDWHRFADRSAEADPVRAELELSLNLDIPIVPVLVQGASMPSGSQFPSSLAPISYLNAAHVRSDPEFHDDVDRLAKAIKERLAEADYSNVRTLPQQP